MAGRQNYRTRGNLALKPEADKPTAPKYSKRGNVLSPDYRQKGIAKSLEQPGQISNFPTAGGVAPINRLRQSENAPSQGGIAQNKDNLNYTGQKAAGAAPKAGAAGKLNPLQRLGGFFGKHKGASIGGLSGILVGGTMMLLSSSMSGPLAIVHAAEFIGDIVDTIHDTVRLARDLRNGPRALQTAKAARAAKKNARMATTAMTMARTFKKTLAKAGMEVVQEGGKVMLVIKEGSMSLRSLEKLKKVGKFVDEGKVVFKAGKATLTFATEGAKYSDVIKSFQTTLKTAAKARVGMAAMSLISKSKVVSSMVSRITGIVNKLVDFHPIRSLTQIIAKKATQAGEKIGAIQIKKMAANFIKKRAMSILGRAGGTIAGRAAAKIVETVASKLAKAATSAAFKGLTKVLGFTGIGAIVSFALGFAFELIVRRLDFVDFAANLNIAAGYAGEFQAWSDQVKSGDFPTETAAAEGVNLSEETVHPGEPAQEIGIFIETNIYSETPVMADNGPCSHIAEPGGGGTEEENAEEETKYLEEVNACVDNLDAEDAALAWGEPIADNFWGNVMVNHEIDPGNPLYNQHSSFTGIIEVDGDNKSFAGDVPIQLMAENYDADGGWTGDIINSAIAALPYNIIGAAPDWLEKDDGSLDTINSTNREKGAIATAGARALSNTKLITAGGYPHDEGSDQDVELQTARRQAIQSEFNAKPLLAQLFDVEDYHSAVVTLARDSGWNTADPSIGNSLKNVAKTFALLPSLITTRLNKISRVGAADYTVPSDYYGFGTVGYTEEELAALPDYDVAAEGVVEFYNDIHHGETLRNVGVKEITSDGRVKYNTDTDAGDLDVESKNKSGDLARNEHKVLLCDIINNEDDPAFIWVPDGNDKLDEATESSCFSGQTVYGEKEQLDADGKKDDDDDVMMTEDQSVVIAGYATYSTDQMVRAYLLDYPSFMMTAAQDYLELCDGIEDTTEKANCEAEKEAAAPYIEDAMQDIEMSEMLDSAVAVNPEDQAAAEKLLQMRDNGDLAMTTWSCVGEGGSVQADIQFIADNGNAHFYENGNCSSPDHSIILNENLMPFIVAAAEKLKENNIKLTITGLVASARERTEERQEAELAVGVPIPEDTSLADSHYSGSAVDLGCPEDNENYCKRLLDEVAAAHGLSNGIAENWDDTVEPAPGETQMTTISGPVNARLLLKYIHYQAVN
jgi:hypothetical protein